MVPVKYDAGALPVINGHLIEDISHWKIGNPNNAMICYRGPDKWCISDNMGDCLNKQGEWESESLPSSRTDEFLERTRFPTAETAYQYFLSWRKEFLEKEKKSADDHEHAS